MLLFAVGAVLAASGPASVRRPVANMYSKADLNSDVVSQAIYGTRIEILETAPGWARIKTPDDYEGWMPDTFFMAPPGDHPIYAAQGKVAEVSSLFANLYREPDVTQHEPVLTVPFEARLEVTAEPRDNGGRWIRVGLVDGGLVWVQRGDVTLEPVKLSIDEMIAFSRRFLGLPYLWGGTSTFGYDCSGFVQMLYRRMGIIMPRDAGPQAEWNRLAAAPKNALRPGDLLYFGGSERDITHTGLYIGGGEFINATVHERPVVRIDKLGEPVWQKLFVAARRLK